MFYRVRFRDQREVIVPADVVRSDGNRVRFIQLGYDAELFRIAACYRAPDIISFESDEVAETRPTVLDVG